MKYPPQTKRDGGASLSQREWNDRPMPLTQTRADPNLRGPSWWERAPQEAFTQQARARVGRPHDV